MDLATKLGFALWRPGSLPASGVYTLPKTGDDVGIFLSAYSTWLMGVIESEGPDLIVYEQPIMPRITQIIILRKLYGLAGVTEMIARDMGITYREAAMQKWRKHFMGRGGGYKKIGTTAKEMCLAECEARGFEPADDNEADALGILDYTAHKLKIPTDWPDRGLLGRAA